MKINAKITICRNNREEIRLTDQQMAGIARAALATVKTAASVSAARQKGDDRG